MNENFFINFIIHIIRKFCDWHVNKLFLKKKKTKISISNRNFKNTYVYHRFLSIVEKIDRDLLRITNISSIELYFLTLTGCTLHDFCFTKNEKIFFYRTETFIIFEI